ncbi:MAG TPA: permease [Candidatus Limnocylindrales bacterium]|nr:permease [Candidatus Limnocylindrales bacterium]
MATSPQRWMASHSDRRDWLLVGLALVAWLVIFSALPDIAAFLSFTLLGLDSASSLGQSVNFFIYDVPKILLLLTLMVFAITVVRTFITPEQTRRWLGGKRLGVGNLLAASVGVVTPFCSCSAVPLFIGFVEAGLPLGVTFSYLVAAPMVNEVALVMLFGLFGWQVAGLYLASGMVIAVAAGLIIGRLGMERYVEEFVYQVKVSGTGLQAERLTWHERFATAWDSTREIVGKVWPYVLIGIGIGAAIHGFVPEDALADVLGNANVLAVPVAVAVGVPLYSNAAGVIPIVAVLLDKGVSLGTALAFMMSVVALSIPEIVILRRVMKPRLIAVFVGVVAGGIILTGYLFNWLV